jgi:chromosome segregation ATPase
MTDATLDPLKERIERLLTKHEASRLAQQVMEQQIAKLTTQRDDLQQGLTTASHRIASVLARLPATNELALDDESMD